MQHVINWAKVPEEDIAESTYTAYKELLLSTIKSNGYINRFWNYVPNILINYSAFNLGRQRAFAEFNITDFPTATAIDSMNGKLSIIALVCDSPSIFLENRDQTPAYKYPAKYGNPQFSRACLTDNILYISGTASIIGHETIWQNNIIMQTHQTMEHIADIVKAANKITGKSLILDDLEYIVYVFPGHAFWVVSFCLDQIIPNAKITYKHAIMCREDLLVEIEASEKIK